MDDLDDYFGDEACDAFVSGLKFDNFDGLDKQGFAQKLIENDDLLLHSLAGKPEEQKKIGKVMVSKGSDSQFQKMTLKELVVAIQRCELSGHMYPKDEMYINNFVLDNRKKDTYTKQDILDLTRMLIKMNI
jgi:hypothetical protein